MKPPVEIFSKANELLYLLKPLYVLADNGDFWGCTLWYHLIENLAVSNFISYAASLVKQIGETLSRLCAIYVDYTLRAKGSDYVALSIKTEQ